MPLVKFLSYNNAVPIAISVMLLGAGGVFAASDPGSIYSTTEEIVSIDNTYLVAKDLATYTPTIQITGVTEDEENYYVLYTIHTIDIEDAVWQDIARAETMQVSKPDLGLYRDLGVYVTEKMKDIVSRESQRLADTQKDARTNVTQKVVATEYGGLIGKFLDRTTEQLPGYTPVVQPQPNVAAVVESVPPQLPSGDGSSPQDSPGPSAPQNSTSQAPVLEILGNNPAEIPKGTTYSDLGAVIVSPPGSNLGVKVFLNGIEMQQISLDTTIVKDWIVTYTATDANGNKGTAVRTVRVFDPNPVVVPAQETTLPAPATPPEQPAETPTQEPEPVVEETANTSPVEETPVEEPAVAETPAETPAAPAESPPASGETPAPPAETLAE